MAQTVTAESHDELALLHYRLTRCLHELQCASAGVHDDDTAHLMRLRRLGTLRRRAITSLCQSAASQVGPTKALTFDSPCVTGPSGSESDALPSAVSAVCADVPRATATLQSHMRQGRTRQGTAVLNAALPLACIGVTASRVDDDLTATNARPTASLSRTRSTSAVAAAATATSIDDGTATLARQYKPSILLVDEDDWYSSAPVHCGPLRREQSETATHYSLSSSLHALAPAARGVPHVPTTTSVTLQEADRVPSGGAEDVVVEEIKQAIVQMKTGVLRVSALMQQEEPALQRSNALLSDELVRTRRGARQLGQLSAVASTVTVPRLLRCVPGAELLWQSVLGPLWTILRQALVLATIVTLTATVCLVIFATHKPYTYRVRA